MKHTVELTEEGERALTTMAQKTGRPPDALLGQIANEFLRHQADDGSFSERIRSRPSVMGGDACIRETRIPVWLLVQYKQSGLSDERILANYPGLSSEDLRAAWDYYAANSP